MPKADLKRFKLLKRTPAGKITVQDITAETVQVEASHAYTMVDAQTGKLPTSLQARRVGDDLQLLSDGEPVIRLEGFYKAVNGNTAFDGSGELFSPLAGSYDAGYALVTGDPLNASDKVVVGKAAAVVDSGWSLTGWGWAGLAGLGAAGIAAATGGGGGGTPAGSGGTGAGDTDTGGTGTGGTGTDGTGTGGTGTGGTGTGGTGTGGTGTGGTGTGGTGTGGTGTGGTGTGGTSAEPPGPVPISARAGYVGIDGLAGARVSILHDANANGSADIGEGSSGVILARADATGRGQFEIPGSVPAPTYDPARSVLQLTSSGGTSRIFGVELPVTGPVQYMGLLTNPVDPEATRFDVVLSPLSTLASHLWRTQFQHAGSREFDRTSAYAEHLTYVSDALGLSMPADRLLSTAPSQGPVQRLVIERQLNALLVTLVSLDSGRADSRADGWSGATTADIAVRLGHLIEQRGHMDFTDPAQLQNVLASVLPLSLPAAALIAGALAPLMTAFAMASDGDFAASLAAQEVLQSLARIMAAHNANMIDGTLDDAVVRAALRAEFDVLSASLARAVRDSVPATRVIVTAAGAFLDRNADGRLDAQDEVSGARVAAGFIAGGNADPAAGRVVMTYQILPGAGQPRPPATLGADDRVEIALDAANFGHRLNLSWSASDAHLTLKPVQDRGLVTDLSLTARERGSTALVSIGRFAGIGGPSGDPVSSALGAVSLLAAGSAAGATLSTVDLRLALGPSADAGSTGAGRIAGPLRVHAAGMEAHANANVQSIAALDTGEVALVTTGLKARATATLLSGGAGLLKVGQAALVSHAADSRTALTMESGNGGVRSERGLSALASGTGSQAQVAILSDDGAVRVGSLDGTAASWAGIHVVASGDAWRSGSTGFSASRAGVTILSGAGAIAAGDVSIIASGSTAAAELVLHSTQGTILIAGATRVIASGQASIASATLTGDAQGEASPALSLTGPVTIDAAGVEATASLTLAASAGTLEVDGAARLHAVGYGAEADAALSAAGGMTLGGDWEIAAGGHAARADLVLRQAVAGRADLDMGALRVVASGVLSGASVTLERGAGTTGAIEVGALTLDAHAHQTAQLVQPDQIVVQLLASGERFEADGPVRITASGHYGAARLLAGSLSSDATVAGDLVQESLGYRSRSQVTIDGGHALAITQGLCVRSDGAASEATLVLAAAHALSTGDASTPALEGGVRIISQGINSTASLQLLAGGAAVRIGGDLELERTALTAGGLDRSTRLTTATDTASIVIDGRLALTTGPAAVDGKLSASLHARSTLDPATMPVDGVPPAALALVRTGGELRLEAGGFNALTELGATLSGPGATFETGGSFSVISRRSGDLQALAYGAAAELRLSGVGASLEIGGDWLVQSSEALGRARSDFVLDLMGGAAGTVLIGGDIAVSALGYGSRAVAALLTENAGASGMAVTVADRIDVTAQGAGAFAALTVNGRMGAGGGVSVSADSGVGAPGGAYASLAATAISAGSQEAIVVDAVHAGDMAVLTLTGGADGGRFRLGSATGAGTVYLATGTSFAQAIDIAYTSAGAARIDIGVEDRDFSIAEARDSLLTVSGFRAGTDQLLLSVGYQSGPVFLGTQNPFPSTLEFFLQDAMSAIGSLPAPDPRAAAYYQGVVWREDAPGTDIYLAFDYDGVGLSGLIKLDGFIDPTSAFAIPAGLAFNPYAPVRTVVTDSRSQTSSSGNVVRADIVLNAAVVEERSLVLSAQAGQVALSSLRVSADEFGKAIANLSGMNAVIPTTPGANPVASVGVTGTVELTAKGAYSQSTLSVQSQSNAADPSAPGVVRIGGNLTLLAAGDQSETSAAITGDLRSVSIAGSTRVEAAGVDSHAALLMLGTPSRALSMLPANDILVHASGQLATTNFSFTSESDGSFGPQAVGSFTLNGKLTAKASAVASESMAAVDVRTGLISIGRIETLAEAAGARATATVGNPSLALHQESHISVGQLLTRASGAEARATTSLTATSSIGTGNLAADADGDHAKADIELMSIFAAADLGAVRMTAAGVDAHAGVVVTLGFVDSQPVTGLVNGSTVVLGDETVVYGLGDIRVSGGADLLAAGFLADATIELRARGSDVRILGGELSVHAAGAEAEASAIAEAGTRGPFTPAGPLPSMIAAAGRVAVDGRATARASGDHGMARISLISNASDILIAGDLASSAEGHHSEALVDLRSWSLDDPRVAGVSWPDAPVRVGGALSVSASGVQAAATATVVSGRGEASITGGLSIQAAGVGSSGMAQLDARSGTIRIGGEAVIAATGSASEASFTAVTGDPVAGLPDEGSISFAQGLALLASGSGSAATVGVAARSSGTVLVGGALKVGAHGDQSGASLQLTAAGADSGGTADVPLVRALGIAGRVEIEATAARAIASAQLEAGNGSWSAQGLALLASGTASEARLAAADVTSAAIGGDLQLLAAGDAATAEATLEATASNLSFGGGVYLLATGDASSARAALSASAGKISIGGDVNVAALGESSLASLVIEQPSTSDGAVAGSIRLMADSGANAAAGAFARAELALGKLDTTGTDLFLDAVQAGDKAAAQLQLHAVGGKVQLGGDGQAGTAELTLLGRHLVEEVSISFGGSAGRAVLSLQGQDVNATTAGGIGLMEVDGFRIAQDLIRFYSGGQAVTAVSSGQGSSDASFRTDALSYFADAEVGQGLYARSIDTSMYVAYDYDGNGVDGIVVLEDVTLAQFRQYVTASGLG